MKKKIREKLNEIFFEITNRDFKGFSLLVEGGGELLFLYHYAKLTGTKTAQDAFDKSVERFLNEFGSTSMFSLCSGSMGNIWLLEYFNKAEAMDDLLSDIKEDLNTNFLDLTNHLLSIKNYDYLHGLLGVLYSSDYTNTIKKENLEKAYEKFVQNLIIEDEVCYIQDWMDKKNKNWDSDHVVNFGLAHGIPSIVSVLSKANNNELYLKYVTGILNFILKYKKKNGKESYYPTAIYDLTVNNQNSRLGWCYGDLGIACAFWNAGEAFNNESWKSEALDIITHSCLRKDLKETGMSDAGICHGTAGLAHIYYRFYLRTKNETIKKTAYYWLDKTLEMSSFKDGTAGYKFYQGEDEWLPGYGMLEGVSGIGLALLSFLTTDENELHWDNALLIS